MGKIRKLSPEVISKIAAGEVIERPCFVVKELIENSLDAGAGYLKIEVKEAGLGKIKITDDGEGMDKDDLLNCWLPHTTSKLDGDNLTGIQTLGFRGEALASIASVAEIEIISRWKGNTLGRRLKAKNGKLISHSPCGAPVGTTVTVKDLFAELPARKKFLKSLRTEYRHILDIVTSSALAYPRIRFELFHNRQLIFDLPGKQTTQERIRLLLGPTIFEQLIPLKYQDSYLKINGFLCKPQISSSTSNRQQLFINGRKVADNLISLAVKEAYGSLLESSSFPIFIIFLEVPFEMIDINVHPRKENISFYDPRFIFNGVRQAVSKTLAENNLTFANLAWRSANFSGKTDSYLGRLLRDEVITAKTADQSKIDASQVIRINDLYLVCPTSDGIIIFDQHAASERLLYNKFLAAYQKHLQNVEVLSLAKSLLLELSTSDSEVLKDNLSLFLDLGFIIEPFGQTSFKVEQVPVFFRDWDVSEIIRETLEDLSNNGISKKINSQVNKMLSLLACRSAIKAGDKLHKEQAEELINQLNNLDMNYTCPHGRPLKVKISTSELNKLFKRR